MRRDDLREVVNLQKLFNVAVYLPFGPAMVRRLIRIPRNPLYDFMLLGFLWYQHAVVSGYGMLDDLKLGWKNIGQIFGRKKGGTRGVREAASAALLDTMDVGNEAAV